MPDSVGDQSLLNKLRRRIGSVGAAAAALLAQYSIAEASQPVHRLLNTVPAASVAADKRSASRPVVAPLVLTPGTGSTITPVGGHRSHSSHSSHRSHTSASYRSHSSHYSATVAAPRTPSIRIPVPRPSTRTRIEPEAEEPEVEQMPPEQVEKPKVDPDPAPAVDFTDPTKRFKVLSFSGGSPFNRVTIEDLKENEKKRLKEGELIGGFKVVKINLTGKTVEIRGDDKKPVTLKWRK